MLVHTQFEALSALVWYARLLQETCRNCDVIGVHLLKKNRRGFANQYAFIYRKQWLIYRQDFAERFTWQITKIKPPAVP